MGSWLRYLGFGNSRRLTTHRMVMTPFLRLLSASQFRLGVMVLAALPCLAILFTFNPAGSGLLPPCPFRALTGFYCPGCGTLRGIHHLLRGQLMEGLSYNPLMVLFLPFLFYALLSGVLFSVSGRRFPGFRLPATGIWLLLGVIILFWILRNVPAYPFSSLAP
jgi:hypothetical protein